MSEMVDRAEIALRKELARQAGDGEIFYRDEDGMIDGRADRGLLVRAVLAELREPTEAMHTAGEEQFMCRSEDVWEIWRAMIDAALAE